MDDDDVAKNKQTLEQIRDLESICKAYYSPDNSKLHTTAKRRLQGFETNHEYLKYCKMLLSHSKDGQALMLAATSMHQLLTKFWIKYTLKETLETRQFVLNWLSQQHTSVPPYVLAKMITIPGRIANLGWNDPKSDEHKQILPELLKFLKASISHAVLGLSVMKELVIEINTHLKGYSITMHRKTAVTFRDSILLSIFQVSLQTQDQIREAIAQKQDKVNTPQYKQMVLEALDLAQKCLSFDFIGTHPEESLEDFTSLQVPSNWRNVIQDTKTVQNVLEIMWNIPEEKIQEKAMELLVQYTSIRRSIFASQDNRSAYLTKILEATCTILQQHASSLQYTAVYVHYCRVLVAIKSNYKLDDIAEASCYQTWIGLVAQFTKESFKSWKHSNSAIHYLIQLWARIILSIPYMRWEMPTFLDQFIPQIAEEFLNTRLLAVKNAAEEDMLSEFYESGNIDWQLRHMPTMNRFQYQATFKTIVAQFDKRFEEYKNYVQSPPPMMQQQTGKVLQNLEAELSWIIFCIGSTVMGTVVAPILICTSSKQRQDAQAVIDAALCARCFRMLELLEARLSNQQAVGKLTESTMHLDLSLLYFCNCFRRTHIGYGVISQRALRGSSEIRSAGDKLFQELSGHLLSKVTQEVILVYMIKKIDLDLRVWQEKPKVIEQTLRLFSDLISGYGSGKLMMQLGICQKMIKFHDAKHYQFMNLPSNFKLRTKYYSTMGRIIFTEMNLKMFNEFMKPFDEKFEMLSKVSDFRREDVKKLGVGLFRDLRGLVNAIFTSKIYRIFFDWIYPTNFHIFLRMFETWWDTPAVVIPMLRFFDEFIDQKSQRIHFPCSSPDGIILFKETSKVLNTYGERMLKYMDEDVNDPYKDRYKGIMLCMKILSSALNAEYVNFGVFKLYNDPALQVAITIVLKLVLSIKLEILQSYSKITKVYYMLLEVLFKNHIEHLLQLEPVVLSTILTSLHEGVNLTNPTLSSFSARSLDYFFCWKWKQEQMRRQSEALPKWDQHFQHSSKLFRDIFISIFLRILQEPCINNHYALCCPVFSLLCVQNNFMMVLEQWLMKNHPPESCQKVKMTMQVLSEDVELKIDENMRTTFTNNMTKFRDQLNQL